MDEDVLSKRFPSLMTPDKGTLDNFKTIKTNYGKVEFCFGLLCRYQNTFHTIKHNGDAKDNSEAIKSFEKGNIYRNRGDYLNALKHLNRCICFIQPVTSTGVELLRHVYKARVSIYLELKLYECCLENLKHLTSINYTHGDKLDFNEMAEIEEICRCALENPHRSGVNKIEKPLVPSLRYRSHKNIPFIVEDVQLKYSDNFGYHLVVHRNLKPGDVIMIEKPYSAVLLPSDWYNKCTNCLASNYLNLIPCTNCNYAMFCSTNCRVEAYTRFHCYECPIMEEIKELLQPELMIALRNTIRGICVFTDLDKLGETLHKNTDRRSDFEIDFKSIEEEKMFEVVANQATNQDRRSLEDLFHFTAAGSVLYKLLTDRTNLRDRIETEAQKHVLMELVLRFTQIASVNSFYMSALPIMAPQSAPSEIEKEFGISTYPLSSFMNHSCAPNVTKTNAGENHEVLMVFVTRPIKAGAQIFDCYFSEVHHYDSLRPDRQRELYEQYKFSCFCTACTKNYPTHWQLHRRNPSINLMHVIAENHDLEKYYANKIMVWKKFQRYCRALKNFDEQYPSKEIYVFYKCMLRCVWLLYKQPPLLYRTARTKVQR